MKPKRRTISERIYRFLLRLFPFGFRREFGSDMEDVFRQERRYAGKNGHAFSIRLWWRTLAGFVRTAPVEHLDVLRHDIRFGVRSLSRKPGFTYVGIAALALGIGANVGVFGLANALLLKPLPVPDPGSVVRIFANTFANMNYQDYVEYRDRNQTISDFSAFQHMGVSFRSGDSPESALAAAVTGNYFTAMGMAAALGRAIAEVDDRPGAEAAAMLSDAFWRRRFGADSGVVGRTLTINGRPFTIVGVAPPGFTGTMAPSRPEFFLSWNALERGRPSTVLPMGRLRPGVSIEQAQAELDAIALQLTRERGRPVRVTVHPARTLHPEFYVAVAAFAAFLMTLAGLVLTIACLNIATMLLAQAVERRREMGIRIALGAGRTQLIRQLLTEGLLLSVAGGGAAVVMALLAARTVRLSIAGLPEDSIALDLQFDWRVGLFALGVSIFTTLLFALAPALQCAKTAVIPALKDGAMTTAPSRSRLRAVFVVTQVAMSTLLLVVGALLVRTLTNPQTVDRGFDPAGVLTAVINLESAGYSPERAMDFQERLLQRLEETPGVISASIAKIVPLTLSNEETVLEREGVRIRFNSNAVSRGHFRTLGIPLLEGRDFNANDQTGDTAAGIVNERFARLLWPGESPIGKRVEGLEIVGMVRDSKYIAVTEEPKNFLYRPIGRSGRLPEASLLVKTAGEHMSGANASPAGRSHQQMSGANASPAGRHPEMNILPAVRAAVHSLDPDLPLANINSLEEATSISLLPLRIAAALAGSLGGLALILGALGIYGVVSYLVRQRTREIGIRMALGAASSGVVRLIIRQAMIWTAAGLGIGLLAAFAAAQLLAGVIHGIASTDPIAFAGITLLLAGTACAACWLPANRAIRIDPLVALREE